MTIEVLKDRICDIIGLPIQNQRLFCDGELLGNPNTIKSYGLNGSSLVELLPYFRDSSINIKITNEEVSLYVDANLECKVKYLKEFVKFKLNIKKKNQIFLFNGKNLDDNATLADYQLHNNAFIYLAIKK